MTIRIEPYRSWSGGAKALGRRAGILRATHKQVDKHGDFAHIINWGNSERRFNGEYINNPENVVLASDKKSSYNVFKEKGVRVPPFTTDRAIAQEWLEANRLVLARKLLRASEGRGIVLVGPKGNEVTPVCELPNAPLYVKYIKKGQEYRVHVFDGRVIDVQQKRRNKSVDDADVNWQIRNHRNGWIFARSDVSPPDAVLAAALGATAALGLDFGAVDIGYNEAGGNAYVYEVNTAPGLEGSTLTAYYEALVKRFPVLKTGMYAKRRSKYND